MKTCKTCKHWKQNHDGMNPPEIYGYCKYLTEDIDDSCSDIIALCEGCVSVRHRVTDFEFVTGIKFGCVNWKKK